MAIAILASVTVSMAEATMGMFRRMSRVIRERMSVGRQQFRQSGLQQDVIEGERFAQRSVGFLLHRQLQRPGSRLARLHHRNGMMLQAPNRPACGVTAALGWRRSIARLGRES